MAKKSIKQRIALSIAARPGEVVLRSSYADYGDPSQVTRAFQGLLADGVIVRLGYGVYAKARPSSLTGKPVPRVIFEQLLDEVFDLLGVDAIPGRAARAYEAGQTTQMPMKVQFYTGSKRMTRKLQVGSRVIEYETTFA
jgi:hypothetical protein